MLFKKGELEKIAKESAEKVNKETEVNEFKKNLEEVKIYMNNYIFEYNNERPQWNRKKMTPVQYRNHLLNSI